MKLLMLKGLPASGKSTFAKELLKKEPGMWKRINKDDLRAMFDNSQWSKQNERFIISARDTLTHIFLNSGLSVIVDDTNFHPKHEIDLRKIPEEHSVPFEIKDFTNVSLDDCLKRDKKRVDSVGKEVIMKMYNQYLKPRPPKIINNPLLPDAIICDVDGTLALVKKEPCPIHSKQYIITI